MKKSIKILIIFLTIILSSIFYIKINAATTGIITEDIVNIREQDSKESKIVAYVSKNDKVDVLEKIGDWYKIKYKDTEGYVYSDYIKVENLEEISKTEESEVTNNTEVSVQVLAETNVKISPNIMSNNILKVSENTECTILEQTNGWSYIKIENINGWIRNEKIKESTESTEEKQEENKDEEKEESSEENKIIDKKAYVKYSSVNLRKEPSTDASVLEKLKLNTEVTILEEVDSVWYKVKVGDKEGYISQELLSSEMQKEESTSRNGDTSTRETETSKNNETKTSSTSTKTNNTTSTSSNTKGEEIANYAKTFLGKPYVYGGSSPSGFDCSGFTSYVYKHFGYTLSRSAAGQAEQGKKVEKGDLQPGDLVIYKNNALTKIGHVGIYIGDNKMIHASEPKTGVIITDIDSKAYKYPQRFVMGRRIIN